MNNTNVLPIEASSLGHGSNTEIGKELNKRLNISIAVANHACIAAL